MGLEIEGGHGGEKVGVRAEEGFSRERKEERGGGGGERQEHWRSFSSGEREREVGGKCDL